MEEEFKNHICECEDCGYKPLKHFEVCPKCNSQAFHRCIPKIEQKIENEDVKDTK